MSDVNQTIVKRIKKLFALAESPNENEAAGAIEKAHALLKQYNLDMAEINEEEVGVIEEEIESGKAERK